MTKVNKKNTRKINDDVRSHIDHCYKIIQYNLPSTYCDLVLEKLNQDRTLTSQIIRNTKNRITPYPSKRIDVLNALVEVSHEYKLKFTK